MGFAHWMVELTKEVVMRILMLLMFSLPVMASFHVEWVVFESGAGAGELADMQVTGKLSDYVAKLKEKGEYKILDHQASLIDGDYFSMLKNYELGEGEQFALDVKGPFKGDHWRFAIQGDVEGFTRRAIDTDSLFRQEYYDEPYKHGASWKERIEPDKVYLFDHDKVNVLLMVYQKDDVVADEPIDLLQ